VPHSFKGPLGRILKKKPSENKRNFVTKITGLKVLKP
jgi:hypothetical protein